MSAEPAESADYPEHPRVPARDDQVMCWGEHCAGGFTTLTGGACVHIVAIACRCYRQQMGWRLN